jgi:hypothetical protein
MSQSQSETDDETEFVTEDVAVVKRVANLKGRQQGLARARETKVRKQKVIKNVMEVHKEINKAKSLTERATTSMNKAKSRAAEEGIEIPTIAPTPAPPATDQNTAMLKMMEIMANEIRTLKAPPPVLVPVPVPAEPKPKKAAPKPKAEPKPKKEIPPPVNIAVPQVTMTPHQVRMSEQSLRIDNLRKALGRN